MLLTSHLHRGDLVHLRSHQLDAVEDLLLVAGQRHSCSEDVAEEKTVVSTAELF